MSCLCLLIFLLSLSSSYSSRPLHSNRAPLKRSGSINPCAPYKPVLPNFNAPGKTISAVKCDEYVWERNIRAERRKRNLACEAQSRINKYIVHFAIGGRNALQGEFPHMGALGWRAVKGTWIFKCGSTLISPKFTLTAAHCSKSPPDPKITSQVPQIVRFGDRNIIDGRSNGISTIDAKIVTIILHPLYSPSSKYYDIALVRIDRELKFSRDVQPACLWNKLDTRVLGSKATLTGWGVTDTVSRKSSPILQAAVVDVIDSEQCNGLLKKMYSRRWSGVKHQICSGKLAGKVDACQGDSGGPLQVKIPLSPSLEGSMHYVIGVTSFGFGCAKRNLPGIYTRVSSFVNWIESIVWA